MSGTPSEPETQPSASASEDDEPSMVVARTRRSNAGNRMAKLMAMEEPDQHDDEAQNYYGQEEWNDVPDDAEFAQEDVDEPDDVAFDSSTDSDSDSDDVEDEDELAGETVLRKEEKAEQRRSKKRRIGHPLFNQPAAPKRPKLETTPSAADPDAMPPPMRSRKKSERVSWLPTSDDGPLRSSKRAHTVQSKEQMHLRLKEKEVNRLALVASMRAAEEKKRNQPAPMTQAERLALAAKVELENVKTLNKWEDAERKREEEQRARLEALKNKKLEGPVVRYWSGPAIWADEKLKAVGKRAKIEDFEQRRLASRDAATPSKAHDAAPQPSTEVGSIAKQHDPARPQSASDERGTVEATPSMTANGSIDQPHTTPVAEPCLSPDVVPLPRGPLSFEQELRAFAAMPEQTLSQPQPTVPSTTENQQAEVTADSAPSPIVVVQRALRNLVTLKGFGMPRAPAKSRDKDKDRDTLTRSLLEWPSAKLPRPHGTVCAITGRSAPYRDPNSGLPYHDVQAYRCIQRLASGDYEWSNLLGAYVGTTHAQSTGRPAAGVPEGFVQGVVRQPKPEPLAQVGTS